MMHTIKGESGETRIKKNFGEEF